MNSRLRINENEAKILNIIGKTADVPNEEIADAVQYKRTDTVSRKLKKFDNLNIIKGPYYDINLNAVGENQLYNIYSIVEFDPENRNLIFEIFKAIPGRRWIFPFTDLDRFFVYFQCNHYRPVGTLMKNICKKKLIQYELFTSRYKWIKRNPDFFGLSVPTMEELLNTCKLPDMSYKNIRPEVKWNSTDLTVMQYLQVWSDSPIEIARREYKWFGKFLSYDNIRYSIKKIKNHGIIESKDYHISPLPREQCSTILLLLSSTKRKTLLRIMENFGKGCRLHKSYTLAGDTGIVFLWVLPEAATNMLDIFDRINFLDSRMYFLRSHETPYLYQFSFEPQMFNIDKQRWEFHSLKVQKEIEELIEREKEK